MEGRDLDTGKFLEFSRYGKMAVPGLSDRFLAGVLPAIVQDYGPNQFGTALNMAYKSFVIGVLIPALQKKGIDTGNEVEASKAVAELAANSNSTS